mmetsp:Transcript_4128/g.16621  ORF Transcript_4128/g.16621 Transcript_4128/m.16621 type:complete len:224 (+) Transcript_4128:84-755(+)
MALPTVASFAAGAASSIVDRWKQAQDTRLRRETLYRLLRLETNQNMQLLNLVVGRKDPVLSGAQLLKVAQALELDVLEQVYEGGAGDEAYKLRLLVESGTKFSVLETIHASASVLKKFAAIAEADDFAELLAVDYDESPPQKNGATTSDFKRVADDAARQALDEDAARADAADQVARVNGMMMKRLTLLRALYGQLYRDIKKIEPEVTSSSCAASSVLGGSCC